MRTYILNMQEYYCDEVSFSMSQIVIVGGPNIANEFATNLDFRFTTKVDHFIL